METFFYVLIVGGLAISALLIVMSIDFGQPPWDIFGKSGNQ